METKLDDFYNQVATKYDKNKGNSRMYPYLIRGMIARDYGQISVLDVGCGPGNVASILMKSGIGHVSVMEPQTAMLDCAKHKLQTEIESGRVTHCIQDALPNMPFENESFDAIMMNLVIHLVDTHDDVSRECTSRPPVIDAMKHYPKILGSFRQSHRVLKPGGILIITTGLPHQLRFSRWYAEFFSWRAAYDYPRQPNKEEFDSLLANTGFQDIMHIVDLQCPLIDDSILNDPYGIENVDWRAGDSSFSQLSESEHQEMLDKVREARDNGELEKIMQRAMKYREQMGQMTIIIARKRCD